MRAVGTGAAPNASGSIRVSDTEKFNAGDGKVEGWGFPFSLSRMAQFAKMYEKYMIHRVTIRAIGLAGAAEAGTCNFGVMAGAKDEKLDSVAKINALRPSRAQHVSHTNQLTVTNDIQLSKWRECALDDSFTLYTYVTKGPQVVFEVSYDVTFSSPRPF